MKSTKEIILEEYRDSFSHSKACKDTGRIGCYCDFEKFYDFLSRSLDALHAAVVREVYKEIEKMLNPEYSEAKYNLAIRDILDLLSAPNNSDEEN